MLSDSLITIYVASGPIVCVVCSGSGTVATMPNICGLSVQQANLVLVKMDITLDVRPNADHNLPAGIITSSVPSAYARFVAYGSKSAREVVVTIAPGSAPSPAATERSSC